MSLEGAYAFNDVGSNTVLDLSGNGRHINLTGSNGAQVNSGLHGGGFGKNGAIMPSLPSALLTACQSDDRTIMFDAKENFTTWWVRFNDTVFISGMWGMLNIGSMAVQARDNSGSHNLATRPTATVPDSSGWHNYCATYVRSTGVISLYRDGALASTSSFAAGTQLSTTANTLDIAEWTNTGPSMDNLRFFSHALDSTQVAALAGTPVVATAETASLSGSISKLTADMDATVTNNVTLAGMLSKVAFAGSAVITDGAALLATIPKLTAAMTATEVLPIDAALAAVLPKMTAGTGIATVTSEMLQQRYLTKVFIDSSPVRVTLTPQTQLRLPSGGSRAVAGSPRPEQTFRLIPMSHTDRPQRSSSLAAAADDGVQRRYDYTLLGEWNSEMEENDRWETVDGQLLVIDSIVSFNGYERKAMILSYGRNPSHV